jgi:regulator of G-protein signaling
LFSEFLKTEFSVENIEFWLACEDFKNTHKEQKIVTKARKILLDFVQIGAQKEVNLEIELRKQTEANVEHPTLDTFDRAQKRIQMLMEKDSYPRFLQSDLYLDLCKVINSNSNNSSNAV